MIHQAKIQYADGGQGSFFSWDGRWFYENVLPAPDAETQPMKYEREWLKAVALGSNSIASIEFSEAPGLVAT